MYTNMSYKNHKDVEVGDILLHKKWTHNGKPLKLEVVKPSFFGSACPGKLTVVLRDTNMHGFCSRQTEMLPQKNGGEAFVSIDDVHFSHRGTLETSVFFPAPKKKVFRDDDDD